MCSSLLYTSVLCCRFRRRSIVQSAEEEAENPDEFPQIPLHQDDPIPHLNLALATSGHAEKWQHVPGLTAVGREWVSAAVFLRDPAASTGDSVMVRLVDHAFAMPVTVLPQIAEDFEGAEEAARRSKGKVKVAVKPKVRRALARENGRRCGRGERGTDRYCGEGSLLCGFFTASGEVRGLLDYGAECDSQCGSEGVWCL